MGNPNSEIPTPKKPNPKAQAIVRLGFGIWELVVWVLLNALYFSADLLMHVQR
jgi:hypothetical protein